MKKRFFLLTLLCASLASLLHAEVVGRINIVDLGGTANQDSLEQVVSKAIGTKVGQELSLTQLSQDVENLAKTRGIDDVQTKVSQQDDGTVLVSFMVSLRQRISEVRFQGNTKYTEKSLRGNAKTRAGEMVDEKRQAADRKAIADRYEKAGYHGTTVTQEFTPAEDGSSRVVLTYIINEATRAKLKGTAFQGNTVFDGDELSSAIMTRRQWWRYIFRFGNYYNPALRGMDISRIVDLYGTKGYLDAQVVNVEEIYIDEEKKWVLPTYTIEEGAPYTLGKRSFEGNTKFSTDELLAQTTLRSGDTYSTAQADDDLDAMKALYEAQGYLDLRFRPELEKDEDSHVVNVRYVINEGEPSRIGEITVTGNTYTRDHVIRRELAIYEEELADARKIRLTKNRLDNLGYFSSVNIVPKTTENPARRDLSIEVAEKPTGSISVGAAFSSEDSLMGFLELSETNFSLQRLLKLEKPKGDGQRMRAYISAGSDSSNVDISLLEPSLFDSPFDLNNELFLNNRYEDEYDERHVGYGITLGWPVAFQLPFLKDHTEYWRMGVGLRMEGISISHLAKEEKFDEDDGDYPDNVRFPEGKNYSIKRDKGSEFTNRLVFNMTRDSRNHFIFPTRGSRVQMNLEYITRALGSYADYMKFHLGAETYLPVYEDVFLRLSADGYTVEHFSGDDVKIFDRFFAGGYGTIRGFRRHDVSPVNRNENSIGGKTMLVGTAEFIKPIKNFMFFKLFCDVGNVWWDSFDADFGDLNMSIGAGIQFKQVPLRLDYGYPIVTKGEHLDGKSGRFHFSIDYSF
ncbi:MAG: outer membrane protein assembly factor BamA [Lentisphaeria bacterium]|nr:outer membrane protein assembly factor BamA [Lentisphaeria bacterium]